MTNALEPPSLATRLVALVVRDERWRDVLLGDLAEEFVAVLETRTPAAARRWYWRQVLLVATHAAWHAALSFFEPTGGRFMSTAIKEIRFGWRALRRRPLSTLVIVLTLALGLGANAATFGMADSLVVHPFPVRDVDRLVMLSEDDLGNGLGSLGYARESVSPANFVEWRASNLVPNLAAFAWWDVNVSGGSEPERVRGHRVSGAFFAALGVTTELGRPLGADDDAWGRHQQAVIADGLWRRRFGADPSVIGRTIDLNGEPYTIVGVAPRDFDLPYGAEIWAPLAFSPTEAANRAGHYLTVIGTLPPGQTIDDVRTRMTAVYAGQRARDPDALRGRTLGVRSFSAGMTDPGLPRALALQEIAALIALLVGCANITSLLLARSAERQQELAVRLAIGASRAQIARQLLIEGLLVALVSVPASLAAGWAILYVVKATLPVSLLPLVPGWREMTLDTRAVVLTTITAVGAAVVFGLAPALSAARVRLGAALKAGGRSVTNNPARNRFRRALVVAEIALTLPLLLAAGLAALAGERFVNGPQGYDPDGVIQLRTALTESRYPTPASQRQFDDRLLDAVSALPGVASAATASVLPANVSTDERRLAIDGIARNPDVRWMVNYRSVSIGYFDTLRIPIVRGRAFSTSDREDGHPVAIVSTSLARTYFGGASPIGRRIAIDDDGHQWLTIVGESGDTIDDWLLSRGRPTVLVPMAQAPTGAINLVARVHGDAATYGDALRRALMDTDRSQPAFDVMTLGEAVRTRTSGLRVMARFMAGFGALTLLLAAVGLYGVMANFVSERRYEIGLRMALGATAGAVFRQIVGQGGRLIAIGGAIGLAGGVALSRVMNAALFGVVSVEPWLLASVTLALTVVAIIAILSPARSAMRTEPVQALRGE
jgi:putative ABC transport system permease protein